MTLTAAIRRMRVCRQTGETFGLLYARASAPYGLEKVEQAQLRSTPVDADGDHPDRASRRRHRLTDAWLYYRDCDRCLPRQCRKRLLLQVRFGDTWHPIELN